MTKPKKESRAAKIKAYCADLVAGRETMPDELRLAMLEAWRSLAPVAQKLAPKVKKWEEEAAELTRLFYGTSMNMFQLEEYVANHPPSAGAIAFLIQDATDKHLGEVQSKRAFHAADQRHSKPEGSRSKAATIRKLWASGKYTSRDICAEQECAALKMSFSSARKALRNVPKPT